MIYFTGDHHFNHANIIRFCNRPFASVSEMNAALINNWNALIHNGDLIYHLGDFIFGVSKGYSSGGVGAILNRLAGQIFFIRGSHDKPTLKWLRENPGQTKVVKVSALEAITIEGQKIVLCHYAMRTWEASCHGSWHLYGHSHGRLPSHGKSFDIGVDANNFYPISLEQVKTKMAELEAVDPENRCEKTTN